MKIRFILTFSTETTNLPIINNLIKEHDISVNIIKADISSGEKGTAFIEMNGKESELNLALEFLKKNKVEYQSVDKYIHLNEDECIHCGACTAVCFAGALEMKGNKLQFETEKCIVCELCVDACPFGLFEIHFG
ncbi:MAG: 4Fe-4S binding protein [Candidatus Marinimicrobia bacterium]|nr:4Fe-4S binding protein [Candidatus Neomarinimicrobiota bacterium]